MDMDLLFYAGRQEHILQDSFNNIFFGVLLKSSLRSEVGGLGGTPSVLLSTRKQVFPHRSAMTARYLMGLFFSNYKKWATVL